MTTKTWLTELQGISVNEKLLEDMDKRRENVEKGITTGFDFWKDKITNMGCKISKQRKTVVTKKTFKRKPHLELIHYNDKPLCLLTYNQNTGRASYPEEYPIEIFNDDDFVQTCCWCNQACVNFKTHVLSELRSHKINISNTDLLIAEQSIKFPPLITNTQLSSSQNRIIIDVESKGLVRGIKSTELYTRDFYTLVNNVISICTKNSI